MPDITIRVRGKIAQAVGSPTIICGNTGYNVIFDLDSEWDDYDIKTMRVAWTDTFSGQPRHTDVPFILGFAAIPAIADAYEVSIGLYAGNIKTTTPATVPCERCITDGGTYHEDPDPETYAALLELLGRITQGGVTVGDTTVLLDGVDRQAVGQPTFPDVTTIDLLTEPYASSLVNGYCDDDTGAVVTPYSTRVCCTEFVEIPEGATRFKVDATISGTAARAYEYIYDANGDYLKSVTRGSDPLTGAAYWTHQASGTMRAVPSSGKKMRVLCRTSGGGNISPSDVGLFKIMFL